MKDLTGNAAYPDINTRFWDSNDKIIETINDGRPVSAGTGPGMLSPSTMTTMDGTELQVPKSHEFAVIAADENGVTLMNPHGRNSDVDDNPKPADFRLTWDEFNHVFRAYHWARSIRNEAAPTCHHNIHSPSCGLPGLQGGRIRNSGSRREAGCPHGAVVGIREGDGIQAGDED